MFSNETVNFLLLLLDLGEDIIIKNRGNTGKFVLLRGCVWIKAINEWISRPFSSSWDWDIHIVGKATVSFIDWRFGWNWITNKGFIKWKKLWSVLHCINQRNTRIHLGIIYIATPLICFDKISATTKRKHIKKKNLKTN